MTHTYPLPNDFLPPPVLDQDSSEGTMSTVFLKR